MSTTMDGQRELALGRVQSQQTHGLDYLMPQGLLLSLLRSGQLALSALPSSLLDR